ncbi:MAG: DNA-binding response regulator [Acidimicrobiia bacterium]|nr:DNA-binding response regulator [Acidimicrobiia bacterium]
MPEPPPDQVRVTLANDFSVIVAGLAALLAPYAERIEVVDFVIVGREEASPPVDVLLFDTFGRFALGVHDLERLVANPAFRHVVAYSTETSPGSVARMLDLGASGYFTKDLSAEAIVEGLERVARGVRAVLVEAPHRARHAPHWPGAALGLTERESEVLALLSRGFRNNEIGEALFVSVDTVKSHVKAVYRKLGVRNRAEAVAAALFEGSFAARQPT